MDNQDLLISVYQNTSTAVQSINDLIKKTEDKVFIDLLNAQYDRYDKLQAKIEKQADKENIDLKDNNWFEKARLWTSIQFSTITDNSTRHLAELMLMGTVMGTLTCYKSRADHPHADPQIMSLLEELEELEEKNFNELKKYLRD